MDNKSQTKDTADASAPEALNTLVHLQEAGLGNMLGMSTAWIEAVGDMGAEVASFVAERIKEDIKTQHDILHCKNVHDLQQIQAEFIQNAMNQYQAETGKLLKMSTEAFAVPAEKKGD